MEMSPAVLGLLAGSLSGFVVVRLMNVRWRHRTQADWVGRDMLLKQPPIRSWLGVGLILSLPIMLGIVAVARGPSNPLTPAIAATIIASVLAVGALVWAVGRRWITVSSETIELHGIWGRCIAWSDLATVHAFSVPSRRTMLVFSRGDGKAIALDSTYYGWEEFLEKVSEIAPQAGSKVARAMERLEAGG